MGGRRLGGEMLHARWPEQEVCFASRKILFNTKKVRCGRTNLQRGMFTMDAVYIGCQSNDRFADVHRDRDNLFQKVSCLRVNGARAGRQRSGENSSFTSKFLCPAEYKRREGIDP